MSANTSGEVAALDAAARSPLGGHEWLTVRLGSEEYGIDIQRVREIRGYEAPTRIAGASAAMLGVLNLRGLMVPIADLRVAFGLPGAFDAFTVTVVLHVGERQVGVVVDGVSDVVQLTPDQIKPSPPFDRSRELDHIGGIAVVREEQHERMIILTDIERLLGSAKIGFRDLAA